MWGGKWFGKWFGKWMGYRPTPLGPVDDPEGIEVDMDLSTDFEAGDISLHTNLNVVYTIYPQEISEIIDNDDTSIDMPLDDDYEIDMPLESDHVVQSSLSVDYDIECVLSTDLDPERQWVRKGI